MIYEDIGKSLRGRCVELSIIVKAERPKRNRRGVDGRVGVMSRSSAA
jgi:hypothetical protein